MKKLGLAVLLLFLSTASVYAAQTDRDSVGFVYWSPSLGLGPYGSIRIGRNDWEFGLLATGSGSLALGVDKILKLNDLCRVEFGPVYGGSYSSSFGFYSSIGIDWRFWSYFALRGEIGGVGLINNMSFGFAQFGLALHI